jgi:hypothetical protein
MQLPKVAVRDRFAGEMRDMKTDIGYDKEFGQDKKRTSSGTHVISRGTPLSTRAGLRGFPDTVVASSTNFLLKRLDTTLASHRNGMRNGKKTQNVRLGGFRAGNRGTSDEILGNTFSGSKVLCRFNFL